MPFRRVWFRVAVDVDRGRLDVGVAGGRRRLGGGLGLDAATATPARWRGGHVARLGFLGLRCGVAAEIAVAPQRKVRPARERLACQGAHRTADHARSVLGQ
jgi:hypothetical protein